MKKLKNNPHSDRIVEMLTMRPAAYPDRGKDLNDAIILAAELLDALETLHNHAKTNGAYQDSAGAGAAVHAKVTLALQGGKLGLTPVDQAILRTLESGYGWCIADIAGGIPQEPGTTNRQHSAMIHRRLVALQRAGLVHPLDDKKPIAWVRG